MNPSTRVPEPRWPLVHNGTGAAAGPSGVGGLVPLPDPATVRVWLVLRIAPFCLGGVFTTEERAQDVARRIPGGVAIGTYQNEIRTSEGQPRAAAGVTDGQPHGTVYGQPRTTPDEDGPGWCRATAYGPGPEPGMVNPYPCIRMLGWRGRSHAGMHRTADGTEFGADGDPIYPRKGPTSDA